MAAVICDNCFKTNDLQIVEAAENMEISHKEAGCAFVCFLNQQFNQR